MCKHHTWQQVPLPQITINSEIKAASHECTARTLPIGLFQTPVCSRERCLWFNWALGPVHFDGLTAFWSCSFLLVKKPRRPPHSFHGSVVSVGEGAYCSVWEQCEAFMVFCICFGSPSSSHALIAGKGSFAQKTSLRDWSQQLTFTTCNY